MDATMRPGFDRLLDTVERLVRNALQSEELDHARWPGLARPDLLIAVFAVLDRAVLEVELAMLAAGCPPQDIKRLHRDVLASLGGARQ